MQTPATAPGFLYCGSERPRFLGSDPLRMPLAEIRSTAHLSRVIKDFLDTQTRQIEALIPRALRWIFLGLGVAFLIAGIIGLMLPVVPQVPFFVLALFFFARSSRRLYNWMLSHKLIGPVLSDWDKHRAISRKVKILTTASVPAALAVSLLIGLPFWMVLVQLSILALTVIIVWSFPEPKRGS